MAIQQTMTSKLRFSTFRGIHPCPYPFPNSIQHGQKQRQKYQVAGRSPLSPPRSMNIRCQAADFDGEYCSDSFGETQQIPIFPLGLVAFPGADVPLQIFEARYRVLFSTLLAGKKGIDDLLVQQESPFKGSKKFGLNFISDRGLVEVGTTLEIQEHTTLEDGRLLVINKGVERYRIKNVIQQKPVLICDVEILPEDDDCSQVAKELSNEVIELFVSIQKLNLTMKNMNQADEKLVDPETLKRMSPRMVSYWITSLFHNSQMHQQALLEMHSSRERLAKLKDILEQTQKYLRATSALKHAFDAPSQTASGSGSESDLGSPQTSQQQKETDSENE